MENIKKVFVFGDSYMAGQELVQCELPSLMDTVERVTGKKHQVDQQHGNVIDPDPQSISRWYSYEKRHTQRNHQLSTGGRIAKKLDADLYNYARPGYSNNTILASVAQHAHEFDEHSLVIVGITGLFRSTDYNIDSRVDQMYCQSFASGGRDIFAERFEKQCIDETEKYISGCAEILSIRQILGDVPNVFIDSFAQFTENVFQDPSDVRLRLEVRPDYQMFVDRLYHSVSSICMNTNFTHAKLKLITNKKIIQHNCLWGHYNVHVHEQMADDIVLEKT